MQLKTRTWALISVVSFLGAAWFWHLGNEYERTRPKSPGQGNPTSNPAVLPPPGQTNAGGPVTLLSTPASVAAGAQSRRSVRAPARPSGPVRNTPLELGELMQLDRAILLGNAWIDTGQPLELGIPGHLRARGDPGGYVVQARGPIRAAFRRQIENLGAEVISYIPNNAYLVRASEQAAAGLAALPEIQAVLPWEPYYKLAAPLLESAVREDPLPPRSRLSLQLYPGLRERVLPILEAMGVKVFGEDRTPFGPVLMVVPPADALVALARLPEVEGIEPHYIRQPANDLGRERLQVATNTVVPDNYLSLDGAGVLVNVNDTGVEETHPDLTGRVFGPATFDGVGHGTHVAGTIASSGASGPQGDRVPGSTTNANYRGMAPAALLYALPINLTFGPLAGDAALQEAAARTNAFISNNSWSYPGAVGYTFASASWDAAVRDALPGQEGSQPLLVVAAAGNSGGGGGGGQGGNAGSIEAPATAKNVITVGAVENLRRITNDVVYCCYRTNQAFLGVTDSSNQVAGFSARGNVGVGVEGPTGRVKPDVVAPGAFVVSTRSSTWEVPTNNTRLIVNTLTNRLVAPGQTNLYSIFIPAQGIELRIRTRPVGGVGTVPPLLIHARAGDPPTTADFRGTNDVTFPVISDLWFYSIGNTNSEDVTFDLQTVITVTNDVGTLPQVLTDLNDVLKPDYRYESGTSMAAAGVSGMLALMQQYFEQWLGLTNSPALMKALLINGARTLSDDYTFQTDTFVNHQGWGLPNLTNSLPLPLADGPIRFYEQSPTNALVTGRSQTRIITLASNVLNQPLRITLVWTDPPGNPAAAVKLVNDLDLVVTNLVTSEVFVGNSFGSGGIFTDPSSTNEVLVLDRVNNVENIYLQPPLSGRYSVTVTGRRVNVNAVTAHPDGVAQDYALVVSSGTPSRGNPLTITEAPAGFDPAPRLVVVTNGVPLLNQTVGANTPLLVETNGVTNQWSFFVLTNRLEVVTNIVGGTSVITTNGGPFVAFITFLPPNLSRPRYDEADIDMYVSADPAITNLDETVLDNALRSTRRGGSEAVVVTNSPNGTIYYVGIKSEDQQASLYGFYAIATSTPFSELDEEGNQIVRAVSADIPDGTPDSPQAAFVFGVALSPMKIQNLLVTNIITHELGGDLVGNLSHETRFAVLNNHREFQDTAFFVYDDSDSGEVVISEPVDGPGSLRDFVGDEAVGVWQLTMVDDAQYHTGRVDALTIRIEPQNEETNGVVSYTETILPFRFFYTSIDVPADATNLEVCVSPDTGPVEVYLRRESFPSQTEFDVFGVFPPGQTNCLSLTPRDSPPLSAGRYFIGIYNPNPTPVTVRITIRVERDLGAGEIFKYRSTSTTPFLDDAMTNAVIFVNQKREVFDLKVGVRVEHERVSDLVLHLISPQGTRLLLAENRGRLSPDGYGAGTLTTNKVGVISNGGYLVQTNVFGATLNAGTVLVDYQFFTVPDRMTIYYDSQQIFDSGVISGTGSFQVDFGPGTDTNVVIVMNEGNNSNTNTLWEYTPTILSGAYFYTTFTDDRELTTNPVKFATLPFVPTNTTVLAVTNLAASSDFESVGAAVYTAGNTVDGWTVLSNQVEVVNNPAVAYQGNKYLLLAPGIIERNLPTRTGRDYRVQFAHRDQALVSWWPGENNTLDIVNTNHASVVTNAAPAYRPGYVGTAFGFDGTNSFLLVPPSATMNVGLGAGLTFEAWIYPDDLSRVLPVFEWNSGTGNVGVQLWVGDPTAGPSGGSFGALYANIVDSAGNSHPLSTAPAVVTQSTWQHVAVTYNPSSGQAVLYRNGVAVRQVNLGSFTPRTSYSVYVGRHPPGSPPPPSYYSGMMDELSLYSVALTGTEVQAIYNLGSGGKAAPTASRPTFQLALDGFITNISAGANWEVASIPFTAPGTNSVLRLDGTTSSVLLDDFQLLEILENAVYYQPEEPLRPFRGENAWGRWRLEIWDNRVGGDVTGATLLSWRLDLTFVNTNVTAVTLTNGLVYTNLVAGSNAAYFKVYVPLSATMATNSLSGSGPLDLIFNQSGIPVGDPATGDYFLLTNTTNRRAVITSTNVGQGTFELDTNNVSSNQRPDPDLRPGYRYYLCVRNTDPTETNAFSIRVDFDRSDLAVLNVIALTNALPYTNTIASTNLLDYYSFLVSSNAYELSFALLNLDGDVNLVARRGWPLPNQNNFQYRSVNSGTDDELIHLTDSTFTLLPGLWYLGVINVGTNPVTYTILATETTLSYVDLTNAVPFAADVPVSGTDYYRFVVSSNAFGADFETFAADGNVDLYLRQGMPPLPGPADFFYAGTNAGNADEFITVTNNAALYPLRPGAWWAAVVNNDVQPVNYSIRAFEHTNSPVGLITLTNALGYSNQVLNADSDYYLFTVSSNAVQANFEVLLPSSNVDLLIGQGNRAYGLTNVLCSSTSGGSTNEFIRAALNGTGCRLTPGDWFLIVTNLDPALVSYTVRVTEFVPGTTNLVVLTNSLAYASRVNGFDPGLNLGVDYYQFIVSTGAVEARFELFNLSEDANLFLRRGLPLPGPGDSDYESSTGGLGAEFILVSTNSLPVALAPGDWYLAVSNRQAMAVDYSVRVTEIGPGNLVILTNALPYTNSVPADDGRPLGGIQYYALSVSSNAIQAHFETFAASGDVDLYVRKGTPLPWPAQFDAASTNTGAADEWVVLHTNSAPVVLEPGDWFIAVVNRDPGPVDYAVCAAEFRPGVEIIPLFSGVAVTNQQVPGPCRLAGAANYYLFNVSTTAQRAQFELLRPDGNAQLVVRRTLPLPGLGNADYASTNSLGNDELIVILPGSAPVPLAAGDWYVGVINATTDPLTYAILATEFDQTGTNLVRSRFQLTSNALCITWTNTLPGVRYYVLGSVSLTPPLWVPVSSNLTATAFELTYCVPLAGPYHFFRLAEGLLLQAPFSIAELSFSASGFLMQWNAEPGRSFAVQWTAAMPPPSWNSFSNVITSTTNLYQFLDDGSQSGGLGASRFYRLLELP